MGSFSYEERDECGLAKDKTERKDAILAIAYADGRRAGLMGLSPAGRPEDSDEAREWLRGYNHGVAATKSRAA